MMKYAFTSLFMFFFMSFLAHADRDINNVTLTPSVVAPDETVSVSITVTGRGRSNDREWESTGYQFYNGSIQCENHRDFDSDDAETVTFDIIAPSDTDIYDVSFYAYENDQCSRGESDVYEARLQVELPITISCPDTSSYTVVFDDDFSTTDNEWDIVDLDRNTVNVWPGESIYSNSENQNVEYEIQSGKININGSVTSGSDNEYGMVLHDLADEYVDDTTTTIYSISTSLTSNSSSSTNNDAGVVFGYVDESNFYLLRWTKYASGYSNNNTFQGEHRSLDLIKMENGTAVVIDFESDFYESDDIDIKVTVNESGITVCINDSQVINVADEHPAIGKVGFFSYDNDEGISFDDFEVSCEDCDPGNMIGWWAMEGNFDDSVLNNDLTMYGSPTFSVSNIAKTVNNTSTCQYVELDGFSYGRVADSGSLNSDELTVSAWIYPTSYPDDENDTNNNGYVDLMAISSKDENYEFHINKSGKLFWWWRNTDREQRTLTSNSVIPLNDWSHVAITYKPGQQSIYINGVLEVSSSYDEELYPSECDYFIGTDVSTNSCNVIGSRGFFGNLDEVRIYRVHMTQEEIEEDINFLRACDYIEAVDHYEIQHDTSGLTCLAEEVTIVACADETCSSTVTDQVTGNLTINGSSSQTIPLDFSSGSQAISFSYTDAESITLGLSGMTSAVESNYTCTDASCQMSFLDSGYIVTAPDFESATTPNQVTVKAVKTDDVSQTCVPDYVGSKPVSIDFSYQSPDASNVSDAEKLNVAFTSGGSETEITSGVGLDTNLTFDATDALSSFYISYDDAGQLSLSISDQNDVLISGSDNFVVYPSHLVIQMTDGDNNTLGGSGNLKHTAAQPFNLNIHAINDEGDITENYRPGEIQLSAIMNGPTLADGANNVVFNYTSSSGITAIDSIVDADDWNTVSLSFDGSGYSTTDATFNNVGSFSVNTQDKDYFGYTIATSSQVSAGEFIPYFYSIVDVTQGAISGTMSTNTIAYIGETLNYADNPQIEVVAMMFDGLRASNYQSSNFPANDSSGVMDLFNRSYTEQADVIDDTTGNITEDNFAIRALFNGGNTLAGNVALNDNVNYDGSFIVTISGDTFQYAKNATPIAPFNSEITLTLTAADLTDDDGVGYCSGDNPITCPGTWEPYTMAFTAQPEMRYGRLVVDNGFGPDNVDIRLNVTVEYFDGTYYVVNTEDSATDFSTFTANITNNSTSTVYSMNTVTNLGNLFDNGNIDAPDGLFVTAQGESAELILELDNIPAFLQFDWDGDGDLDLPSAAILFGRYRGNDRIIYKRER